MSFAIDKRLVVSALAGTLAAMGAGQGWAADKPAAKPAAAAAKPAAAAAAAPAGPTFKVKGFRSATFGMTRAQVLAAIESDFKVGADKVQVTQNAQDRTTSMVVNLPSLDPGPGPATLTYILGATGGKLIKVGVVWIKTGEPTAEERLGLVNDGLILANYFRSQAWAPNSARAGVPIGPNALVLFVGQDTGGAAVEVDVQGVAYDQTAQDGKTASSPPAKGPAALVVAYTADVAHPDVYHLPAGAF